MDKPNGEVPSIARDPAPSQQGVVVIKLTPIGDGEFNVQCGIQNVDKKLARTAMIQSLASLDAQIREEEMRAKADAVVIAKNLPKHGKIV